MESLPGDGDSRSSIPFTVRTGTFGFLKGSGLFMNKTRGRISVKIRRTHGDILCVVGDLKLICKVYTVSVIDIVTTIIINSKYFPIRGITKDVGGFMSESNKKKTVRARRIEMESVIFSPESDGR